MDYSQPHILTKNTWNNALSFNERNALLGKAEIRIPSIRSIFSLQEIQHWREIVLEEIDENGTLHSCTGLAHLYYLEKNTPTYIFDNHNHALYAWLRLMRNTDQVSIIHIDQHSDLNPSSGILDLSKIHDEEYIREFTNHVCQISNFIQPFLKAYPATDYKRIKSESELLNWESNKTSPLIVDIDIDFRAPEMGGEHLEETIQQTKLLINQADLITIATSPMFIKQDYALEIVKKLLS